jgi:hypothetical protein
VSVVLGLAASSLALYDAALGRGEMLTINAIAAGLARDGVDVSPLLEAESAEAAADTIRTLVREITPAVMNDEEPSSAPRQQVGQEFNVSVNRVSRVTEAQFPLTVRALSARTAAITLSGVELSLNLTETAVLPDPKSNCALTFLASSVESSLSLSYEGVATFSIDCSDE